MKIRPEEITAIIKSEIAGFAGGTQVEETGQVLEVGDGGGHVGGGLTGDEVFKLGLQ